MFSDCGENRVVETGKSFCGVEYFVDRILGIKLYVEGSFGHMND